MVDRINEELEKMLPVLEYFQVHGLFTKREVRDIVAKRKAFEFAVRALHATPRDWLRAIDYERGLQALLDVRAPQFLRSKHKYSIKKRIRELFARSLQKFAREPEHHKALMRDYIQFLKGQKAHSNVSALYARAVRDYPMDVEYWIEAARWEMDDHQKPANARGLLQQALRLHPHNADLHVAYFRMELQYGQRLLRAEVRDLEHELVMSHLPTTVTEEGLRELLMPFGRAEHIKLSGPEPYLKSEEGRGVTSKKPRHMVRAAVRMRNVQALERAIEGLNGKLIAFGAVKRRLLVQRKDDSGEAKVSEVDSATAESRRSIMKGAIALIVYSEAVATPLGNSPDFHFRFLEACSHLTYSTEVQNDIARRVYQRFPADERCLIRYISRKLHYFYHGNASVDLLLDQKQRQEKQVDVMERDLLRLIEAVLHHAEKATTYLPGPRIWEEYVALLQFMVDLARTPAQAELLAQRMTDVQRRALNATAAAPCPDAASDSDPDPDLEVHWVPAHTPIPASDGLKRKAEPLSAQAKRPKTDSLSVSFFATLAAKLEAEQQWAELSDVLRRGVQAHPHDVSLWTAIVKHTVRTNPSQGHDAIFREALAAVGPTIDAGALWRLFVQYTALRVPLGASGFQTAKKLMQEAICAVLRTVVPPAEATGAARKQAALSALCSQYIEYCEARGGSAGLQTACSWLLQHLGLPLEVYLKMIAARQAKKDVPPLEVRNLFEACLDRYGADHADLWLQYIVFEDAHKEFVRIQRLHDRATRTLHDPREFVYQYLQWKDSK